MNDIRLKAHGKCKVMVPHMHPHGECPETCAVPLKHDEDVVDRRQMDLIDWRIGHHIEAGASLIAHALNRIADGYAESNTIQRRLVQLQEENIQMGKVMREMADSFLRGPGGVEPTREPIRPPDWLKDELKGD